MLTKVKHGIGAVLFITGLMAMDSPSLLIPTVMFIAGAWMIREVWMCQDE